jgi:hypothetical protein
MEQTPLLDILQTEVVHGDQTAPAKTALCTCTLLVPGHAPEGAQPFVMKVKIFHTKILVESCNVIWMVV